MAEAKLRCTLGASRRLENSREYVPFNALMFASMWRERVFQIAEKACFYRLSGRFEPGAMEGTDDA